eukprot:TRINITY_DN6707_c0_g1_i1.p1 TRINITY_DN6707_c0_g1~~TRINITY_DN6707_c0_g1_i1.p1  ORF type:complete len:401 (-),score=79.87 TRINITY_DN6707_c0_g1_i1:226-1380(-)
MYKPTKSEKALSSSGEYYLPLEEWLEVMKDWTGGTVPRAGVFKIWQRYQAGVIDPFVDQQTNVLRTEKDTDTSEIGTSEIGGSTTERSETVGTTIERDHKRKRESDIDEVAVGRDTKRRRTESRCWQDNLLLCCETVDKSCVNNLSATCRGWRHMAYALFPGLQKTRELVAYFFSREQTSHLLEISLSFRMFTNPERRIIPLPNKKNLSSKRTFLYQSIVWTANAFYQQDTDEVEVLEGEELDEISTLTQVKLYRPLCLVENNEKERDLQPIALWAFKINDFTFNQDLLEYTELLESQLDSPNNPVTPELVTEFPNLSQNDTPNLEEKEEEEDKENQEEGLRKHVLPLPLIQLYHLLHFIICRCLLFYVIGSDILDLLCCHHFL